MKYFLLGITFFLTFNLNAQNKREKKMINISVHEMGKKRSELFNPKEIHPDFYNLIYEDTVLVSHRSESNIDGIPVDIFYVFNDDDIHVQTIVNVYSRTVPNDPYDQYESYKSIDVLLSYVYNENNFDPELYWFEDRVGYHDYKRANKLEKFLNPEKYYPDAIYHGYLGFFKNYSKRIKRDGKKIKFKIEHFIYAENYNLYHRIVFSFNNNKK
jgi:hypothetical protein